MCHSSGNFTPDPRGKILLNKPLPAIFCLPGERLNDKGNEDYPNFTLGACAANVKLILGVGGMRKA
jgi:hypothetical protein